MSTEIRYRESHEWARRDGELVTFGITDHAQDHLGDVVFVDLPAVGAVLEAGQVFGVVESVKAASDLFAPVSGTVVEVNGALVQGPEAVNQDPEGRGWMVRVRPSAPAEWDQLLDAAAYARSAG